MAKTTKRTKRKLKLWTKEEDQKLRSMIQNEYTRVRVLKEAFPDRTYGAIRCRIASLKLNPKQGKTTFGQLKNVYGVCTEKLRKIAVQYKVKLSRALPTPEHNRKGTRKSPIMLMDPGDIEEKIEEFIEEKEQQKFIVNLCKRYALYSGKLYKAFRIRHYTDKEKEQWCEDYVKRNELRAVTGFIVQKTGVSHASVAYWKKKILKLEPEIKIPELKQKLLKVVSEKKWHRGHCLDAG